MGGEIPLHHVHTRTMYVQTGGCTYAHTCTRCVVRSLLVCLLNISRRWESSKHTHTHKVSGMKKSIGPNYCLKRSCIAIHYTYMYSSLDEAQYIVMCCNVQQISEMNNYRTMFEILFVCVCVYVVWLWYGHWQYNTHLMHFALKTAYATA